MIKSGVDTGLEKLLKKVGLSIGDFDILHHKPVCEVVRAIVPVDHPVIVDTYDGRFSLPVYRLDCKTHGVASGLFTEIVPGTRLTFSDK